MSLLGPDRMLVGREVVPRQDAKCIHCHQPFKGGNKGDPGVNVYSRDGMREVAISGICETCFDGLFEESDEDETQGYTAWCSSCGGPCLVLVTDTGGVRAERCDKCGGEPELEPPTDEGQLP